ncbi:MAG: hypothetical protein DSM107014_02850 [Gomphosphaeria aponina SAG 52.96 = DSM 107014]|uniref:Uncharacterized protein n=1 Tax=Gomphosphaeria aponina SAG 52.96 = DSM 107014 TaxID=1521640 RepID=A0A941GNT9_9CHRO|nr:hypothetical protein [Gomphosphaeria aponina SAG 52.96 = DSM 107014]
MSWVNKFNLFRHTYHLYTLLFTGPEEAQQQTTQEDAFNDAYAGCLRGRGYRARVTRVTSTRYIEYKLGAPKYN